MARLSAEPPGSSMGGADETALYHTFRKSLSAPPEPQRFHCNPKLSQRRLDEKGTLGRDSSHHPPLLFSAWDHLPMRLRIYLSINTTEARCSHAHTHTHCKPMSTVVYCANGANTHSPQPLLPMETRECVRTHVTLAALDNKLFQGQIADKNPFFHPAKKDQE